MEKRVIVWLITLNMLMSIFTGCTNIPVDTGGEPDKADQEFTEDISDDQLKIVDMADREVLLPKNIEKVFSTGPVGTIVLYTLSPEKIIGWNYTLKDGEKRYIDKKYHSLPDLGGAGKSSINSEELLKQDPDILINMVGINKESIEKAERLEDKLDIPVIMIDDDIEKLDESYKLLGKILGEKQRSEKLSNYIYNVLEDIKEKRQNIEENKRVSIYYAEGPNGLETEPSGSWHAELIDMVGGKNVAEVEAKDVKGKSQVSIEQVISWNPHIIISWDDEREGYYSGILSDPIWKDISAVKDKEVYEIENNPFNWFDRPPSVNRILGLQWLGNLLYPEIYDYHMRDLVKEFYLEFYHYNLNEQELYNILKNTSR